MAGGHTGHSTDGHESNRFVGLTKTDCLFRCSLYAKPFRDSAAAIEADRSAAAAAWGEEGQQRGQLGFHQLGQPQR